MSKDTKPPKPATPTDPVDLDALPPGGGSYTRQPDGTLVPADVTPPAAPAADPTTPATSE